MSSNTNVQLEPQESTPPADDFQIRELTQEEIDLIGGGLKQPGG